MSTQKKFLMYLLWTILFFIFSQVMIYIALNTTYRAKRIDIQSSAIEQAQIEATSINGFARIKIKNDNDLNLNDKYIKLDCYSKNGVLMGTKYIQIDDIKNDEEKEFNVRFNFSRVDNANIQIIDQIPENATEKEKNSDQKMTAAMVISALVLLIAFG